MQKLTSTMVEGRRAWLCVSYNVLESLVGVQRSRIRRILLGKEENIKQLTRINDALEVIAVERRKARLPREQQAGL